LQKEVEFIKKLGVQFEFNQKLGDNLIFEKLTKENDAVYLGIGAWKEMEVNIPGDKAKGVFSGTEFLKNLALGKKPKLGQKVAIIGAGNVAIDAARSIWRLGRDVTVVYRREKCDMPANKIEIVESEAEKINYRFMSAPKEVLVDKSGKVKGLLVELMDRGGIDFSGRRKPIPTGKFEEIECDSIIMAIGERVETEFLTKDGLEVTKDGRIVINPFTFETSLPKVYAGGDAVTGPSTAAEAMGMARKAAESIDLILMKEKRFHKLFRIFEFRNSIPTNVKKNPRNISYKLAVGERIGNFHEVDGGFTGEQARNEVNRCLRCDVKC